MRWRGEYLGLRLLSVVLRMVPIDTASTVLGWGWRAFAPLSHRHARVLSHLAFAYPDKTEKERQALARAMWTNLGRVFAESFLIGRIAKDKGRIYNQTNSLIKSLETQQKGIVFISLHTGNWELVSVPTLETSLRVAGVYKRLKNPWAEAFIFAARRLWYPGGLFAAGPRAGRSLLRILRRGGAVAMLADLRDRRGESVPFFGRPAPSTTFPAQLARGSGAALVAARVVRLKGARFRIEARQIPVPCTDDKDADVKDITRQIQAQFETWIREYPEQWMWTHKRWG